MNGDMRPAACACNGQAVTQAQFYSVACDPGRHVVVEACAGAGKTSAGRCGSMAAAMPIDTSKIVVAAAASPTASRPCGLNPSSASFPASHVARTR